MMNDAFDLPVSAAIADDELPPAAPEPTPVTYRVLKALSPDAGPVIMPGELVTWVLTELQQQILIDQHNALEIYIEEKKGTEPHGDSDSTGA